MTKKLKLSVIFIITLLVLSFLTGLSFLIYNIAKDTQSASYTLTIDKNGGNAGPSETTYTYAQGTTINLGYPHRPGFDFLGWMPKNYVEGASLDKFGEQSDIDNNSDPFFQFGISVRVYGSDYTTFERINADTGVVTSPSSDYILKITSDVADGRRTGFYATAQSYDDSLQIMIFTAKLPQGYWLQDHWNQFGGVGANEWSPFASGWLTSNLGTGEWETYVSYFKAFDESFGGVYSHTGHYSIAGPEADDVVWYVANVCMFDATDTICNKGSDGHKLTSNDADKEELKSNLKNYIGINKDTTYTFGSGNQTLVAIWSRRDWRDYADTRWEGSGTSVDPYLISSAEELAGVSNLCNSSDGFRGLYFKQTADINLSGKIWDPIGSSLNYVGGNKGFYGNFDGNGYKIKGMFVKRCNAISGLFGYAWNAVISNVTLVESSVYTTNIDAGLLLGLGEKTYIENCYTDGVVVYEGADNYDTRIGGAIGMVQISSTIFKVENNASVVTTEGFIKNVGGIVGLIRDGSSGIYVGQCINRGTISGSEVVGGIVGDSYFGEGEYAGPILISNCYNYGKVLCDNYCAGGICGQTRGGVTISYCINDSVISSFSCAGLIVGRSILIFDSQVVIECCEARGHISGTIDSSGLAGVIQGNASIKSCSVKGTDILNWEPFIPKWCLNMYSITITNSYGIWNDKKVYYGSDFSDFGVVKSMNDGLPLLKSLYYVAEVAPEIDIVAYLQSLGFTEE